MRCAATDGRVDMRKFGTLAPSAVHPLFFIEGIQGASLFYLSEAFGLRGPNTYFSGTAEAGLTAIARAASAIRRGEADVALAGGADAPVCWWNMAKIDSLGLTTASNALGAGACRPFDRDRDGTVMGEGGAFVVLESSLPRRLVARGSTRRSLAPAPRPTSSGCSRPNRGGRALAHAIGSALRASGEPADGVDYVAAHGAARGLGTPLRGRRCVRSSAPAGASRAGRSSVSSVKPATGHLGAGAGALNLAVAALAVHHGVRRRRSTWPRPTRRAGGPTGSSALRARRLSALRLRSPGASRGRTWRWPCGRSEPALLDGAGALWRSLPAGMEVL